MNDKINTVVRVITAQKQSRALFKSTNKNLRTAKLNYSYDASSGRVCAISVNGGLKFYTTNKSLLNPYL